jgi:hypothetical protein
MGTNIVFFDVENYFAVEALSDNLHRAPWRAYACRVESNTQRIMDGPDHCRAKPTFFVGRLFCVEERPAK